jgi:hypothetical protein
MTFGLLGFSHIWGESCQIDAVAKFWAQHGFTFGFSEQYQIPTAKRPLLHPSTSAHLRLDYYSSASGLGLEFLNHGGDGAALRLPTPLIQPVIKSYLQREILKDPDGNSILSLPDQKRSHILIVRVRDIKIASELLQLAGFTRMEMRIDEVSELELTGDDIQSWTIRVPLFQRRELTMILRQSPEYPANPKVDTPGFSGISLLARDLDAIDRILPLTARESCKAGPNKIEVAFNNQYGILFEFLRITGKIS